MHYVIYGAQGIALGAYRALKELIPQKKILCFIVSSMEGNPSVLGGIPVRQVDDFVFSLTENEKNNITILIATPENLMNVIEEKLDESGLRCSVRLNSVRWNEMQKMAFAKSGQFTPLSMYPVGYHSSSLEVYKMVHHKDKPLNTECFLPAYLRTLQVGSAFTEDRIAPFQDNSGDHISLKNRDYSELTGLYWIWKNQINHFAKNTYYGLVHYRRVFDVTEDDLLRLVDNDIDVILPYPMPYEPNIEVHHKKYVKESEWSSVVHALEQLQPEYAKALKEILQQDYLYNYNIVIAKGKVLADYCEWLFPVLQKTDEINNPDKTKEPSRYIGYIAETLETLYFMKNRDNLTIAHSGCRFLT